MLLDPVDLEMRFDIKTTLDLTMDQARNWYGVVILDDLSEGKWRLTVPDEFLIEGDSLSGIFAYVFEQANETLNEI